MTLRAALPAGDNDRPIHGLTSASALTVEVVKKCSALTAKAFPQRETGNPAARSGGGTGLSQQIYFQKCVTIGGNEDNATPEGEK
jgi:hypothetical protein